MRRPALLAGLLLVLAFSLGAGRRPPGLGDVTEIRVFDHPTHTRVVVELSRVARYRTGALANPDRLYIDIDGVWIEAPLRHARESGAAAPLSLVRAGQNTLQTARIVLELSPRSAWHRVFHLQNPFRIVVDVFPSREPRAAIAPAVSFDERPVRRVVIDPGHGGKDPGTHARGGSLEKEVVLRVSLELARQLRQAGFEVLLTRDRDVYLSLEERTTRANAYNADLFVSIHGNSSPNRRTHGVETYLLDTRYDRQTARVAARENGTTIEELSDLQRILASLRLGYNERYAARLAQRVHASLLEKLRVGYRGTKDLGVRHGPFLVLFMADMPSVLVELGFLSNRSEAKRMRSKSFVRGSAEGIARGIAAYRDEHARLLVAGRSRE